MERNATPKLFLFFFFKNYLKRRHLIADDDSKKNDECRIAIHGAGLSTFHPFIFQGWCGVLASLLNIIDNNVTIEQRLASSIRLYTINPII
jgi:hypothetical protein